jgi:hypothetical protein
MAAGDSNVTNLVATGAIASTNANDGLQLIAGDGAISIPQSVGVIKTVVLTKGSAAAITITAPVAGAYGTGDDGKIIMVFSETAFAHVITCSTRGFNRKGSSGTATASAAANNSITLVARNGDWDVMTNVNFTLA